jgi:ATP phosphoribosyltransferase regulatory subunit HisZ
LGQVRKENNTVERNYKALQSKVNDQIKAIHDLDNDLKEFRRSNEVLVKTNAGFRSRAMSAEASVEMMMEDLKLFKTIHTELADEVEKIMDKARSRVTKEVMVAGLSGVIPPQAEPNAPEKVETEKKTTKKQSKVGKEKAKGEPKKEEEEASVEEE